MSDAGQGGPDSSWGLLDVTGLPLNRLLATNDSVLVNALRRLVSELDRAQEVLSAFDNYAGDPPDLPAERPLAR
jgi:FXSXX-COOH protein